MPDGENNSALELEKLSVERARIKAEFWGKVIVSAAAVVVAAAISTFGTVYVAYLQNKGSDQMARLDTQVEILRAFQEQALSEDISQRVRFAHFFSKLSPSEEDRVLWTAYYDDLVQTYRDLIEQALSEGDDRPTVAISGSGNAAAIIEDGRLRERRLPFDQLPDSVFTTGCLDPTTGTPGRLCP